MMTVLVYLVILAGSPVHAADRREAVSAAYRVLPTLLKVVAEMPATKNLPSDELKVYKRVTEVANTASIPLIFDNNPHNFDLNADEATRWMRTQIYETGEIYVNEQLLNAPETEVSLPLLFKVFVHELGHKTGVADWGLRDRVAQFFERQVSAFVRNAPGRPGERLMLLSVPLATIDKEFVGVKEYRPQPTNLVLYERNGVISDLTESLEAGLETPSTVMRTMWMEMNQIIFGIYRGIGSVVAEKVGPAFKQFMQAVKSMGISTSDSDEWFDMFRMDLREVRVLELQAAELNADSGETFLRIKANYKLSRTSRNKMPISITGFEFSDTYAVPISLLARLPSSGSETVHLNGGDIQVSLRPSLDPFAGASVKSVIRGHDGRVAKLVLEITAESLAQRLYLSVIYAGGMRMIEASAVQAAGPQRWRAEFNLQWPFLPANKSLLAESVQLGSTRTVYLDRLVALNEGGAETAVEPVPVALVPGSAGIWGLQNGKPAFFNRFRFEQPLMIIDNLNSEHPSLNPSHLEVEFELDHPAKVREIRVHMKRMATILDVTPKPGDQQARTVHEVEWGGDKLRIASWGSMIKKRDEHEILTSRPEEIFHADTESGRQRVKTVLTAPFLPAGEPDSDMQAHGVPMGNVILIEVVLEDGRVLTNHFGGELAGSCAEMLEGHMRTSANSPEARETVRVRFEY